MKKNNKGFTLMEMLIVVAIIAVLVAIAIPVMTSALEKSREATDAANVRTAYAQVMVMALTEATAAPANTTKITFDVDTTTPGSRVWSATVTPVQTITGWEGAGTMDVAGFNIAAKTVNDSTTWKVEYKEQTGEVTIS